METTKEKILSAARTLFVAHGFAGTSIGNIAKLATVNHSLIFHHFKNKEQLWIAVKQDIVAEANQKISTLPDTQFTFDVFLEKLFLRNIQFYRENPDLIRMISWQRLERNTSPHIGITHSDDMQRWVNAFQHYQLQGEIQSALKPEWIVTLILSIISATALDPNIFIHTEQSLNAYLNFCITSITNALK